MLDPRIYRTGLVAVALAVVLVAFSLRNQQGPLATTLAPEAFNGQDAYRAMQGMATSYPERHPGSAGDDALATDVAAHWRKDGLAVSTRTFRARTVDGPRTLENVTGVLAGLSSGSIVVVAHRDARQSPATAELSGTAVLLELARVLSGETQHRTIVLASTSGAGGAAGAAELARTLPGPVDAVIALGDLAGTSIHPPVLVPWSNRQVLAPPMLRNTVAAALASQAAMRPGGTGFAGQFVHLAFPMAISEQAPFGARDEPAVLLSLSGDHAPAADEPTSQTQITALGRSVLQAVNALDGGPRVPAPSAYLVYAGKLVPAWAIRLLVAALILPVLGAAIDGLARARRRGQHVLRWIVWVLAAALPFAAAILVVLACRLIGLLDSLPAGPVAAGTVPTNATAIAILIVLAGVIVGGFIVLRPRVSRLAGARPGGAGGAGASAAVLLVLCVISLAIWLANPFAAALIVPGLHLWMWVAAPEVRVPRAVLAMLLVAGLTVPALAVLSYAVTLGFTPVGFAWNAVLLLANGDVSLVLALEWSVVLGCIASLGVIAARRARQPRPEQAPRSLRGPITYAGPGSLGGTESALRR